MVGECFIQARLSKTSSSGLMEVGCWGNWTGSMILMHRPAHCEGLD